MEILLFGVHNAKSTYEKFRAKKKDPSYALYKKMLERYRLDIPLIDLDTTSEANCKLHRLSK